MKPRFGKSGWTEYQGMCRIVREPVDDGLVSRKSTADAVGREGLVLKSRTKGARSTLLFAKRAVSVSHLNKSAVDLQVYSGDKTAVVGS
jgi:hypothetical protein